MSSSKGLSPKVLPLALAVSSALLSQSLQAAQEADIEEITVTGRYTVAERIDTATGLGLSLRETPQSVSIMTRQRMQDLAIDTIADVVQNTVGVSINEVDNVRNTFNARGFEINNYQVDGVPLAWSLAGNLGETVMDVAIYDRIEVVRGATGLLTGAGDPSASLNQVRKHASSRSFEAYLSAGAGRWNNRQLVADVANGLNQNGSLRGRAVLKYESGESFQDLYENERRVYYGVLEGDIGERSVLRIGASYQHNDPTAPTWGALPSWYDDGSFTDWERSKTTTADWTTWETTNKNYFANFEHSFSNDWLLRVNVNRMENSNVARLLYLSGLLNRETGLGLASYPYLATSDSEQDSIDVQVKGLFSLMGSEHEFVVGGLRSEQANITLDYAALDFPPAGDFNNWDGSYPNPGFAATATVPVDLETEQSGVYGAARFNLSERLKLIAGGRVASWEQQGVSYAALLDFGDSGEFIPYAGVLYDLTDQHRVYASYTEIFMPQGARDRNGDFLAPLVGKSAELGLKSVFFDDALQTSVAVFRIAQDNLAQPDPGFIVPGTVNTGASVAAQGAESTGVELEVVGQPMPGWNLGLGLTTFEAEDAAGNKVNTDHARKLITLFTTYRFTHAIEGLVIGAGLNWQSRMYSDSTNPVTEEAQRLEQDAFSLVNLMARYEFNPQLSLQLNVENLLDETYYSQVGFFEQYRYGTPRNYSASLNYQF